MEKMVHILIWEAWSLSAQADVCWLQVIAVIDIYFLSISQATRNNCLQKKE